MEHIDKRKVWCSFFSQTGTEILEISRKVGRFPDLIITNKSSTKNVNKELLKYAPEIKFVPNKFWSLGGASYFELLKDFSPENTIITLNGWLKIIPEGVCRSWEMYNGHPGLITKYPELKGRDPQIRAFLGDYETAGCVIHRVDPGVDEGKIIKEVELELFRSAINSFSTEPEETERRAFEILHDASVDLWTHFLFEKLKMEINKKGDE